jgi:hypothetical protein
VVRIHLKRGRILRTIYKNKTDRCWAILELLMSTIRRLVVEGHERWIMLLPIKGCGREPTRLWRHQHRIIQKMVVCVPQAGDVVWRRGSGRRGAPRILGSTPLQVNDLSYISPT